MAMFPCPHGSNYAAIDSVMYRRFCAVTNNNSNRESFDPNDVNMLHHSAKWLERDLGIKHLEDWYGLTKLDIKKSSPIGRGLMHRYNDSMVNLLVNLYPHHQWQQWRLDSFLPGYWDDKSNQLSFMHWLGMQLGISNHQQFLAVDKSIVVKYGGGGLLNIHGNSMRKLLNSVYEDNSWQQWRTHKVPARYWEDKGNQRKFMNWLGEELGIDTPTKWYTMTTEPVVEIGGGSLLMKYDNSLIKTLMEVYPEYDWKPWLFPSVPQGFWDIEANQVAYFEWVTTELGIEIPEQWYEVTTEDIMQRRGYSMLHKQYGSTMWRALQALFPEYRWLPWKFKCVPFGMWENPTNRRNFVDWVGMQLGISSMDDWYGHQLNSFRNYGGHTILRRYGNSLGTLLSSVYPEYSWHLWKFERVPKGFWNEGDNVAKYLQWMRTQIDVVDANDLYHVSTKEIIGLKGMSLLAKFGGIFQMLSKCFPQHFADKHSIPIQSHNKNQRLLFKIVKTLFKSKVDTNEVLFNFMHPVLFYPSSFKTMQLDVFVPSAKLAFEYQGEQHFEWNYSQNSPEKQQMMDKTKQVTCKGEGITLVQIPCWWNCKLSSIVSEVTQKRPDIVFQ